MNEEAECDWASDTCFRDSPFIDEGWFETFYDGEWSVRLDQNGLFVTTGIDDAEEHATLTTRHFLGGVWNSETRSGTGYGAAAEMAITYTDWDHFAATITESCEADCCTMVHTFQGVRVPEDSARP